MTGTLIQSWTIGQNCLDLYDNGINTRLPDGTETFAWPEGFPNVTERFRKITAELGYGDDVMLQCKEHEAAHTLVAHLMGLPYSNVLYAVAHGFVYEHWRVEEAAVLGFQAYCRLNGISIIGDLLGRYHAGH